jgi:hypothetical protein
VQRPHVRCDRLLQLYRVLEQASRIQRQ